MDSTTVSERSITSMLDQRIPILDIKKFPPNNNLPTPNSVQFIDDHDTNMISDLSFCNQLGLKTSHSFRFEDSYDSL